MFNNKQKELIEEYINWIVNGEHWDYFRKFMLSEAFFNYYKTDPKNPNLYSFKSYNKSCVDNMSCEIKNNPNYLLKSFDSSEMYYILCFDINDFNFLKLIHGPGYCPIERSGTAIYNISALFKCLKKAK